ncbi:LysR family transcriptional regulator [Mesobacillus subterraneus]|jgi:LysR family transcriptional regulator, salicylic acid-responsive activator of bsdBCD|uniref:LysR family transcriptional regulator n=1 Tax=Mesobacillus subterraneus TaxID=285983 RepID=UPI00203D56AB|nr:LysR family transcriptional regulator [Mesobacillus subterraneus]MCM3664118.1 LysR family transcriptional regulator [Mesobacillus subterraneus]MCM3682146.1 LysR family transcriptional regulator [Mesobacillus subterraneus]
MDIRQMRYFIAIAEEKNITAAANKLHMSQPPLSLQLKQMEEELGVMLVERHGKKLELTDKGEVLYRHALNIVHSFEEVKNELQETDEGRKGSLSIGINTLSVPEIPEWLDTFHSAFPLVYLRVVQNDSAYLAELVKNRAIELALIRLPLPNHELNYLHLYNEPFLFVCRTKGKNDITIEEISSHPLILPSTEGLGSFNIIHEAFSKAQLPLHVVCECSDMKVLMELVSSGIGTTIVPKSVFQTYGHSSLYAREITDSILKSSLGLIWLKQHYLSRPARNFIELVKARLELDEDSSHK